MVYHVIMDHIQFDMTEYAPMLTQSQIVFKCVTVQSHIAFEHITMQSHITFKCDHATTDHVHTTKCASVWHGQVHDHAFDMTKCMSI